MMATPDTTAVALVCGDADNKKRARLNCIRHLLNKIRTRKWSAGRSDCPHGRDKGYVRPPINEQTFVPDYCG